MKFHQTKAELDRDIAAMPRRQLFIYGTSCLVGEILLVVFMVTTAWRWFGWWGVVPTAALFPALWYASAKRP